MIAWDNITTDEDLGREIIVVARDIAPCIDSLTDEKLKDATAILKRIAKDLTVRGSRMVKAQRIGPASVDYADVRSAFAGQPTRALRALCAAAPGTTQAAPRGSFPTNRPVSCIWPEQY